MLMEKVMETLAKELGVKMNEDFELVTAFGKVPLDTVYRITKDGIKFKSNNNYYNVSGSMIENILTEKFVIKGGTL